MKAVIVILSFAVVGCATIQSKMDDLKYKEVKQKWEALKSNPEFDKEKALVKERLGGKMPCWDKSIAGFSKSVNDTPSKSCLYTSELYAKTRDDKDDIVIAQQSKTLKVLQVTPDGFLVTASYRTCRHGYCTNETGDPVFIFKTDERDLVDGSFFNENFSWDLYEYIGPFSYQSLLGSKTIRSFKKVPRQTIDKAQEGNEFYSVHRELLGEFGAWGSFSVEPQTKPNDAP